MRMWPASENRPSPSGTEDHFPPRSPRPICGAIWRYCAFRRHAKADPGYRGGKGTARVDDSRTRAGGRSQSRVALARRYSGGRRGAILQRAGRSRGRAARQLATRCAVAVLALRSAQDSHGCRSAGSEPFSGGMIDVLVEASSPDLYAEIADLLRDHSRLRLIESAPDT